MRKTDQNHQNFSLSIFFFFQFSAANENSFNVTGKSLSPDETLRHYFIILMAGVLSLAAHTLCQEQANIQVSLVMRFQH